MDGAVHASAAEERAVGRVDDGIDPLVGDVALRRFNPVPHLWSGRHINYLSKADASSQLARPSKLHPWG